MICRASVEEAVSKENPAVSSRKEGKHRFFVIELSEKLIGNLLPPLDRCKYGDQCDFSHDLAGPTY